MVGSASSADGFISLVVLVFLGVFWILSFIYWMLSGPIPFCLLVFLTGVLALSIMSIRNLQDLLSANDSGLFVPALGYAQFISSSSCSVSGSRPSSVASASAGRCYGSAIYLYKYLE